MKLHSLSSILIGALLLGTLSAQVSPQTSTQASPQTLSQSQAPAPAPPVTTVPSAAIQQKIESYLRNLYAWGPSFKLTFGSLKETPIPGIYQITVDVSAQGQSDSATFYVTKDGRYLMRGELEDMNTDPLEVVRKQITLTGYPSKGPEDANVVLVEYADYECPSCRQLDTILRSLLPNFPQVRLIYKDFPLTQIHPWAATAANAGRCAYKQNPTAFWKFHDLVFDNQETISAENVWQRMQDYATQAGLDPAQLRSCMSDPKTPEEINKSIAEGEALHVANTPTIFVNGRRLIAPDSATLEQYMRFDLTPHTPLSLTPNYK